MENPRSILVVDDDETIRTLLTLLLRGEGYAVSEAEDGRGALAALERSRFDAVVLDVMMPGLDGYGVLAALGDGARWGDQRVILLTCMNQEDDFLRGWRLGADDHLCKPFDALELFAKLGRVISASESDRRARREEEIRKSLLLRQVETIFRGPAQVTSVPHSRVATG